ncbi:hypothetical protein AGMMS50222_09790 [Endomicrobiia bacterium]|nr:hypothetical protein AGMMS49531_09390 [Endomicrobiia bacterium]GHT66961.1 hypothetical protein AGMMS49556_08300 [Endomicrobiia bacterium]GHT70003.1 hypothetical protein AGMMS49950_03970 [Endomicrobiia bacterium]GHT76760.1 hypothetical protein AGMMS50222_09790 [Endomicrobiia bacterium]
MSNKLLHEVVGVEAGVREYGGEFGAGVEGEVGVREVREAVDD